MANIKISALPAVVSVAPSADVLPLVNGSSTTKATPNQITKAVLAATVANTNPVLIGTATSANTTRFPNSTVIISNTLAGIQQNESHNVGLVAEGVANPADTNIYGVGVYGKGYTSSATRCGGVVGEGHVSASADTGLAIGVRGYANDTHAGGLNIGLYGDASNGSSSYALYLNNGNIYQANAKTWNLNSTALTFSTGSVGLTSVLEGATVTAGAPAATTNFDAFTQAVQYYTSSATTNFTLNIRGNSSTSLNTIMAIGQSATIALLVTNGTTAYYPTAFTIDGVSVTPKWQFGITPTSGYASGIDVYTFTIVKTASATFTVFASQTPFA